MDPLLNEEDLQSTEEEEEVDPRIQVRITFSPRIKGKSESGFDVRRKLSGYMGFKKESRKM